MAWDDSFVSLCNKPLEIDAIYNVYAAVTASHPLLSRRLQQDKLFCEIEPFKLRVLTVLIRRRTVISQLLLYFMASPVTPETAASLLSVHPAHVTPPLHVSRAQLILSGGPYLKGEKGSKTAQDRTRRKMVKNHASAPSNNKKKCKQVDCV